MCEYYFGNINGQKPNFLTFYSKGMIRQILNEHNYVGTSNIEEYLSLFLDSIIKKHNSKKDLFGEDTIEQITNDLHSSIEKKEDTLIKTALYEMYNNKEDMFVGMDNNNNEQENNNVVNEFDNNNDEEEANNEETSNKCRNTKIIGQKKFVFVYDRIKEICQEISTDENNHYKAPCFESKDSFVFKQDIIYNLINGITSNGNDKYNEIYELLFIKGEQPDETLVTFMNDENNIMLKMLSSLQTPFDELSINVKKSYIYIIMILYLLNQNLLNYTPTRKITNMDTLKNKNDMILIPGFHQIGHIELITAMIQIFNLLKLVHEPNQTIVSIFEKNKNEIIVNMNSFITFWHKKCIEILTKLDETDKYNLIMDYTFNPHRSILSYNYESVSRLFIIIDKAIDTYNHPRRRTNLTQSQFNPGGIINPTTSWSESNDSSVQSPPQQPRTPVLQHQQQGTSVSTPRSSLSSETNDSMSNLSGLINQRVKQGPGGPRASSVTPPVSIPTPRTSLATPSIASSASSNLRLPVDPLEMYKPNPKIKPIKESLSQPSSSGFGFGATQQSPSPPQKITSYMEYENTFSKIKSAMKNGNHYLKKYLTPLTNILQTLGNTYIITMNDMMKKNVKEPGKVRYVTDRINTYRHIWKKAKDENNWDEALRIATEYLDSDAVKLLSKAGVETKKYVGGMATAGYQINQNQPNKKIGAMIAGNSGLPGGDVCKELDNGKIIENKVNPDYTTQEEDMVSCWFTATYAKNRTKSSKEDTYTDLFKKNLKNKWGMKDKNGTNYETKQGIIYFNNPDMEIYKHVLGEVHDAILCKKEKLAPTQSRTNMKPKYKFNTRDTYKANLVFVGGPNANPTLGRDATSTTKRTYNEHAFNDYDTFKEGVKNAVKGALDRMIDMDVHFALVARVSCGIYAPGLSKFNGSTTMFPLKDWKERINDEFPKIVQELLDEDYKGGYRGNFFERVVIADLQ